MINLIYFASDQELIKQLSDLSPDDYQKWIRFVLADTTDYTMFTSTEENIFTLKVSKNYPQWDFALMDFLGYEESYGKNIILDVSKEDFELAKQNYRNHHFQEECIRDYEPTVLVHSTTWISWEQIKSSGSLKSWNMVKIDNPDFEKEPIGKQLGDPQNYCDYIMFSDGHVASEIVVASKLHGYIEMDVNKEYQTGARLYFDMQKIAEDGLLVRDGAHLKVKDQLPIEKYLIWVATWENTGLSSQTSTPMAFTTAANKMFNELYNKNIEPWER